MARRHFLKGAGGVSRGAVVRSMFAFLLLAFVFLILPSQLRRSVSISGDSAPESELLEWRSYSLEAAAAAVSKGGDRVVIVCVVSYPYAAFLINWLISIAMHGRHESVLVIAEDYETLDYVNRFWPGHAVLIPPALSSTDAHRFGSQGFFNFTSRRPQHLLKLLELGYSVLYNDVDMVWLKDPFELFAGDHDIYFTDDMTPIKPSNHSCKLPPPGKKGRTYICSCMLYMRPTPGAKLVLRKWIDELHEQPWSPKKKSNDQPAFNWALNKTADQVDMYLLPQESFPSGGLYFRNQTWREESQGKHTIVHNNYITGFEKKIKRFREAGLWFIDKEHVAKLPKFELVQQFFRTQQPSAVSRKLHL